MENSEYDQLDINQLIDSEMYTYSVSNIEDKRNTYSSGQTVSINFPAGAYILDTNQIYLLFDSVFVGATDPARAMYPRQPEDFFQFNNLEVNGIQLLQSNMSQGRNLFNNWLKNTLTPYKPEKLQQPISSLAYSASARMATLSVPATQVLNLEPHHQVTSADSSIIAYDQAMLSSAPYRQKQYNMTSATGAVVASVASTVNFTCNQIKLSDVCSEFGSLGLLNMCNLSLRFQLKFNDTNRVATSGHCASFITGADLAISADTSYNLSNLCLYYKQMQIKPNLIKQAKMLMNRSRPIMTIYQNIKNLDGLVTNQRISCNTSNLYYAIIFMQPSSHSKTEVGNDPLSYITANANLLNNTRFGSYEDSLEFKASQLTIEIQGVTYKKSIIPVGDRQYKSFIEAQNAVYQCTGQYLNITFNQFINNRYFHIIPLSVNQYPSTIITDNAIVVNVMLDLSSNDRRQANPTTMALNTFIVGSKVLINDSRLE